MFYTYAEKQGNVFFDGWQMRQIAFDTMRRYLYYSAATLTDQQIATPMDNENPISGLDSANASVSPLSLPSTPASRLPPAMPRADSRYREISTTPPQPNLPSDIQWRKKVKVDYIALVAKVHAFTLEDSHLKETDLFQVEIHGETRVLQAGESPAPGPMLVPAAGWAGLPDRFTVDNEEYIADPFFLRELYEALRDQFAVMRLERERLERNTGTTRDPRFARIQTLSSPRGRGEPLAKGNRVKIVFRLRTEYELRRFWFVVQSVLGYDKLGVRPYRGLPPYDPRNGLIFAQVPLCVWHAFKALDTAVMYFFCRGDCAGRGSAGGLTIALRGAYVCITHDAVLVLRDARTIPRWVRLREVHTFAYNCACQRPYMAFLSDPGAPDIVFIPQPPIYGPDAIRRFSAPVETLRARHVVRDSCLASVEARRVIQIHEAPESTVRDFIERVEGETGSQLSFDTVTDSDGALSCPLPKEQLTEVWREVQGIYAARDPVAVSQAAIPLYTNNPNDSELSAEQLLALEHRLERERETHLDIVGIPIDEARRVDPLRHGRATHRRTHSDTNQAAEQVRANARQLRRTQTAANGEIRRMAGTADEQQRGSAAAGAADAAADASPAAAEAGVEEAAAATATPAEGEAEEAGTLHRTDLEGREDHSIGGDSFVGTPASDDTSFTNASAIYGEPGSRYLTETELAAGIGGVSPSLLIGDNHVIMAQTPMAGGLTAPCMQPPRGSGNRGDRLPQSVEMNADPLTSRSSACMRATVPPRSDPPPLEPCQLPASASGADNGSASRGVNSESCGHTSAGPDDQSSTFIET